MEESSDSGPRFREERLEVRIAKGTTSWFKEADIHRSKPVRIRHKSSRMVSRIYSFVCEKWDWSQESTHVLKKVEDCDNAPGKVMEVAPYAHRNIHGGRGCVGRS